jgi:hypothetical protein
VTFSDGTSAVGLAGLPPIVARLVAEFLAGAPGATVSSSGSESWGSTDDNGDAIESVFTNGDRWGVVH